MAAKMAASHIDVIYPKMSLGAKMAARNMGLPGEPTRQTLFESKLHNGML